MIEKQIIAVFLSLNILSFQFIENEKCFLLQTFLLTINFSNLAWKVLFFFGKKY